MSATGATSDGDWPWLDGLWNFGSGAWSLRESGNAESASCTADAPDHSFKVGDRILRLALADALVLGELDAVAVGVGDAAVVAHDGAGVDGWPGIFNSVRQREFV